jgi:hypothetical protein
MKSREAVVLRILELAERQGITVNYLSTISAVPLYLHCNPALQCLEISKAHLLQSSGLRTFKQAERV